MELCALQLDLVWEDRAANFAAVEAALAAAAPRLAPGSLLVLPEMFSSGFSMNVSRAADTSAAETEIFLAALARAHQIYVLGGLARQLPDGSGANEACAFSPHGNLLARYRKIHSFSPAGEAGAFTAGREIVTFPWNGFTVAPVICYDLRFPELFRAATAAGADLFCVIANWPDLRQQHKTILLRARAIENQAFVLGLNRCGTDPHFSYAGASALIGPQGEILTEAGSTPTLLRATLSPDTTAAWRTAFPALRDRRTDLFTA
jgi:predicted amidohydrolase